MREINRSNKPFPARHFGASLLYAFRGLRDAFNAERNFRTHTMLALLAIGLGFYLCLATWEWVTLLLCIGFMLAMELLNTAIEGLVDIWAGTDIDERARRIKDISAGACLVTAAAVGLVGLILFVPHLPNNIYK